MSLLRKSRMYYGAAALLTLLNVYLAAGPTPGSALQCNDEKRVCDYWGDPNPTCTTCGSCICWECDEDCTPE